ncbi:MAG TPA: pantoate--beta-alanine ligase [Gemmatimonadaceae bacterium]|nr:pantoate--beta-alanine ligase [Gemmatimonadaceae bacterium]
MRTLAAADETRSAVAEGRRRGARVAFVPTMGALHEGHLALVNEARRQAELVVMSIFVNPLQFGPAEDLARYPRDLAGDAAKAAARGVDLLFTPDVATMYPRPPRVTLAPGALAERWEGAVRPGHFAGVLTVVAKLFNVVQPDVAVFGQKDIQQATLVRAMARDLDFPLAVVVAPTVREPDGLAMSSRNVYLRPAERRSALALPRALDAVRAAWRGGEADAVALTAVGRAVLDAEAGLAVDYLALVDPETLEPLREAIPGAVVVAAVRAGATRLIDNIVLGGA